MTIGEVRRILEENYDEHYKKVIELDNISMINAIKYIQEQTSCDYEIAKQIVHEWANKADIKYNPNGNRNKSVLERNIEQTSKDVRFFKNLIIIFLILSGIGFILWFIALCVM